MILNETYDEILERLDRYSLNESLFGQVKDQIKNQLQVSKILYQCYSKIQYEITNKIENCLSCLVGDDGQIANTFDVTITFDDLYDKKFIAENEKKAKAIINHIINEYNDKLKECDSMKLYIKFKREIKHISPKSNCIMLQYSYESYL